MFLHYSDVETCLLTIGGGWMSILTSSICLCQVRRTKRSTQCVLLTIGEGWTGKVERQISLWCGKLPHSPLAKVERRYWQEVCLCFVFWPGHVSTSLFPAHHRRRLNDDNDRSFFSRAVTCLQTSLNLLWFYNQENSLQWAKASGCVNFCNESEVPPI